MKFTQITLTLAALLTASAAQGLGDLPDCARSCATDAIPSKCGIDVECICTAKSFIADISCCIADKCSKDDQDTTLKVAKSICARGGVTDIPSAVTCSTGASTATGTAATASTAGDTTKTGSMTTATGSKASETGSSTATTSAAETSGAAVHGQVKDTSLMAAAGAVAAVAFFV